MPNTASRAATRRVPSMGSWAVSCPCAILTNLVVTGMWPEPTRRDTPLEGTRCGPSHFQRSPIAGFRSWIIGSASAHEAQHAAREHRLMDLNPNPPSAEEDLPTRVHVPVRLHFLGCWQGPESPCSRSLCREPSHTPQPSLVATCELCGFLLIRALNEDLHAHCKSGTAGMSHNRRSSANLLSTLSAVYSGDPIGVPRTVIPLGCHTAGPSSSTLSGTVPEAFHILVFPSWNRMPATRNSDSANKSNNTDALAGTQ